MHLGRSASGATVPESDRRKQVDILLVYAATTMGLLLWHEDLMSTLVAMGLRVAGAAATEGVAGRFKVAYPLIDIIEGLALRRAADRATSRVRPRAIIYETATAVLFEPDDRLQRGAVRFDAPASMNRPGRRNAGQRWLQLQQFDKLRMLLPATTEAAAHIRDARLGPPIATLFSPLRDVPTGSGPRSGAICYAGDPFKKGLDLVVAAWAEARMADQELVIAGIDASTGRNFLRSRRVAEPPGLRWAGRLAPGDYRRASAGARFHLAAPRFDEYASAQLEALHDGALLVCAPPLRGPFEPLRLARELDPRLVARDRTPESLARAIRYGLGLSEPAREEYRARAQQLLKPYGWPNYWRTLNQVVLPRLLDDNHNP